MARGCAISTLILADQSSTFESQIPRRFSLVILRTTCIGHPNGLVFFAQTPKRISLLYHPSTQPPLTCSGASLTHKWQLRGG